MRPATDMVPGGIPTLFGGAALGWFAAFGAPAAAAATRASPPTVSVLSVAIPVVVALLAGFLGGWAGSWIGRRGASDRSETPEARVMKMGLRVGGLEDRIVAIERRLLAGAERDEKVGRILSRVAEAPLAAQPGSAATVPATERDDLPSWSPEPTPAPTRSADTPPRRHETINEITARFGRVTSGQIARSEFSRFFDDLGASGGIRVEHGGATIEAASSGEELLTAVNTAAGILVFPSYQFVSNQPTQFATIASVPDEVASIFELSRGDGDLVMIRPAVFEEAEGETRRVSKGELHGFGG